MRNFFVALGFLTKFPVPKELKVDERSLAQSTIFFPVVGFLLGVALVLISNVLNPFLPIRVINLIAVLLLVIFT